MSQPDHPIGAAPVDSLHGAAPAASALPGFDRAMLEALVCPLTHATLSYDAARQELVSRAAGLAFPIRGGIPIMLVGEARAIRPE